MAWLERHWHSMTVVSFLLFPLSLVFRAVVALRRFLYRLRILSVARLPVPVIVVGNLTVGGTGKTPLVLWLAAFLCERGMRPGIVSRGYGGSARQPREVLRDSDPAVCGDEAVMLAHAGGVPVAIGADRAAAGRTLLAAHPECDVLVSDDGLQHYGLARDVEILVIDGARGLGNGYLLPAGPLREPPDRLRTVDAIVVNVSESAAVGHRTVAPRSFAMSLAGREFHNLLDPQQRVGPEHFQHRAVHAIAGIGNPQRFFRHLRRLGLNVTAHPFPDHHPFTAADLAFPGAECVVMTAKDAVKCLAFVDRNFWVFPVRADLDPAFGEMVLRKLGERKNGS